MLEELVKIDRNKGRLSHSKTLFAEQNSKVGGKNTAFNFVTQDMVKKNERELKSYRGHRLPKEKVSRLELWFIKNITNPYLDKKSLRNLGLETGLSSIQVKNWISNRRRKEKSQSVSVSISELLCIKEHTLTDGKKGGGEES